MNYDPAHLRQALLGVATRPTGNLYAHPYGDPGPMPRKCCWPMWADHERPTHRYCGATNVPGRVYCADHCRRAYGRAVESEPRTPGLVTSGGVLNAFSTSAQAGAATPAPVVPAAPMRKPRHAARAKKAATGPGVFVRVNPPIDMRLCVNDRERQIVNLWNSDTSGRAIAAMLGISHNVVSGAVYRIRARRLEE